MADENNNNVSNPPNNENNNNRSPSNAQYQSQPSQNQVYFKSYSEQVRNGHHLATYLFLVLIIVLSAVVLYLLSERNSNHLFLIEENGTLKVMQGKFFPFGTKDIEPINESERAAYAPMKLPPEAMPFAKRSFANRVELNTALGEMLLSWSRTRIRAKTGNEFSEGWSYVKRIKLLTGLPQMLTEELSRVESTYIYYDGMRLMNGLKKRLTDALERFKEAKRLKNADIEKEVDMWIYTTESILTLLRGNVRAVDKSIANVEEQDMSLTKEKEDSEETPENIALPPTGTEAAQKQALPPPSPPEEDAKKPVENKTEK